MAALWRVYPKPMGGDHGLKKRRLNDQGLLREMNHLRMLMWILLCAVCLV